jgi:1A family penicillin-binding protein
MYRNPVPGVQLSSMAEGKQKNYFNRHILLIVLLLVVFLLEKIGEIPFFILSTILHGLKTVKKIHITVPTIHIRLYPVTKHRGRPRTTSLTKLYSLRMHRAFRKVPKRYKIATTLALLLIAVFTYTFFAVSTVNILPSPTRLVSRDTPLTTEIYDRNNKLLYRLYEGRNRTIVNLNELPPYLSQATIAIEDKNFYHHPGFDPVAIARAIYINHTTSGTQGASTITQQLIKNSMLSPEKTYQRKIKELFLAFWAERIYSKEEILQMYLNEAPYGGPAWGVEAASQTYFGKPAKELTLAEASFLAGLPAAPTLLSPYGTHPEMAKERQKLVLARMSEDSYISKELAEKTANEPLNLKPNRANIEAPHFVFYIKDLLSKKYGNRVVSQGGLKVYTTLDLGLQEEVEQIVKEEVDKLAPLNVQNGAAMVVNGQGQILAMVGSKDYYDPKSGNFNVTLALRAPGSSIKPVTYATAFKQGFTPGTTILDTPVNFSDEWGNRYAPVNYDGAFHGPVSIRTALGSSYNIPAVKILATVGVDNVVATSTDMGITTFTDPKNYGLSLTLGGAPTKMIEMMEVYETFSQMGERHPVTGILKVVDSNGNILDEYSDSSKQVLQQEIAYLITSILSDNNARTPAFGPNSLLNLPSYQVAVKTGTSDSKRDNWTFGYTPDFTVGVWVGNNDNSPMNPALTSGVTGAAPIWNKIMKGMLGTALPVAFKRPPGIIDASIDGRKDLAISGILPKSLVRISQTKEKTTFFDPFTVYATSSAQAGVNGTRN